MKLNLKPNKFIPVLQAFFATYALLLREEVLYDNVEMKSAFHYFYARLVGFFGEYAFRNVLIFAVLVWFFLWVQEKDLLCRYKGKVLPWFFAGCLLLGESYRKVGNWKLCFGDGFRILQTVFSLIGYACLLHALIALLLTAADEVGLSHAGTGKLLTFFDKNCLLKVFMILMIAWLPFMLLSYPANLCYDALGQIDQGLGLQPYSGHHPLFHTILMSGIIRFGKLVTGSYNFGLFLYVLVQAVGLALALAGTLSRMTKRGASGVIRLVVLGIYLLSPMYANMASTALKDIPFMAAVLWYFLLLEQLIEDKMPSKGINKMTIGFWMQMVGAQILVGLLRNNGIYMVLLTGIGFVIGYRKTAVEKAKRFLLVLCLLVIPFVGYKAVNTGLQAALHAESGSKAEMLSIPFQQTARYLQFYRNELNAEEREAIEGVLGDVDEVAAVYNPDISDPVKAKYKTDAGTGEIMAYFKVWFRCFFKHPNQYFEAFFVHIYGWFDPGASNAPRYEAESEIFTHPGIFDTTNKLLLFYYRFVEHVPFPAIFQNVGIYVWMLFILAGEAWRKKQPKGLLLLPLFISLLICMASPCFYLHPRYAYPIMFSVPYLFTVVRGGVILERNEKEDVR